MHQNPNHSTNDHKKGSASSHDPIAAWKNPSIKLSPLPKLVGKQMGVMETIGIAPMGYEMKGDIKEWVLPSRLLKLFDN